MTLLGIIGMQEILIILLIVLIFFGGKKIPELMKGLGKGVKEYKKAMNSLEDDEVADSNKEKTTETKENKEDILEKAAEK